MRYFTPFTTLVLVGGLAACTQVPIAGDSKDPGPGTPKTEESTVVTNRVGGGTGTGEPLGGTQVGTPAGAERPDLRKSVYYEFDKYEVKPEFRTLVESHARWLRADPRARLTIEGNTDENGSREYNIALGQRRAESVTALLVVLGAKPEQIEAVSFGKEKPRALGHGEAAWAENRRSDFAAR